MKKFLLLSLCAAGALTTQAQVVINELMQSNIDCIMDDLNEFPDSWVELYNSGDAIVNLKDYKLVCINKDEERGEYQLPSYQLAPGGFKLVYCDKYDGSKSWHAPFRLESAKDGSVYLYKGAEIVDQVEKLKKQPAPNIAYGRKKDGSDKWGYQAVPTPQKANCGTVYGNKDIVGDPVFSIPGQVYEGAATVELILSLPEGSPEGTVIRYTTDGSEPTENSTEYKNPIKFSSSKIVRAKLFCDGYLSPRSLAQSYLFLGRKMTLPVVSIQTDKKYLTDKKIGIYVDPNYKQDWRRPINLELFDVAGSESVLNQLCETRIQGGATRSLSLKSLALYANKRFGEKRFSYEFFPEDRPGQTNFKSLLLRSAGNDFDYLYMRDAIIQRVMAKHVDVDWQAWRPSIVFINGEYRGIENFRERSNDDNIFTNYNELEDIEVIENWNEVKTGDGSLFKAFKDFYTEHGHTWEEYDKVLDVSEFLDVMIMELYFNNVDAPGNNFCIWRPTAEGGRWRSIIKDVDYTMFLYGQDPYNYKILNWLYDPNYDRNHNWGANGYDGTRLFRRLMEDETFQNAFFDRCSIYMGDFMNLDGVWEVWEPMYEMIKEEYPIHRALFNVWWPNYAEEMRNVKNWLSNRTSFFYNHLKDYYKLGTPVKLQINKELTDTELADIDVEMNGVKLSKKVFDGKFFAGREVRLSGKNVASWEVTTKGSGGLNTETYQGAECKFMMPDCTSVTIVAVPGAADAIYQIATDSNASAIEYYDVQGIRHRELQKGQNIVRMSDGTVKKVLW